MIIPFPEDLHPIQKYPLTFTLVLINVLIFVAIFAQRGNVYSRQEMLKPAQLELTGRLYHEWRQTQSSGLLNEPLWLTELQFENNEQMQILGGYALRSAPFIDSAEDFDFQKGDLVLIGRWKKLLSEYKDFYLGQSIFQYGLNAWIQNPLSWITYQFSHSNWIHLLSNMMFLVMMGVAVEALVGSAGLLLVYLMGGLAGGALFTSLGAHGVVPMVGASASISALMAFYCVAETRFRIRYFYMLMPFPGYFGPIYLPTLLIVPLFLVVDLASLISTPEGWGGGVAYSAHLGGAIWGILTALIYRSVSKSRKKFIFS